MTICEQCKNRLWPETERVQPGQNIKCKKGFEKNMKERHEADSWVFQQKECDFFEKRGGA